MIREITIKTTPYYVNPKKDDEFYGSLYTSSTNNDNLVSMFLEEDYICFRGSERSKPDYIYIMDNEHIYRFENEALDEFFELGTKCSTEGVNFVLKDFNNWVNTVAKPEHEDGTYISYD